MKNTMTFSERFRGYMPVVVDVETGGFNDTTDALLEIAAVFIKLDKNGNFVPGNTIHNHIKPFSGSNLEPESLAINKIDPYNPFRMAIDEYDALDGIFDQTQNEPFFFFSKIDSIYMFFISATVIFFYSVADIRLP